MNKVLFILLGLYLIISSGCCDLLDICENPDNTNYEIGDTIWIQEIDGMDSLFISTNLALGTDGAIYYGASNSISWILGRIFALNPQDGSLKWKTEPIDHIGFSNIIVGDDGTVYAIGYHNLYAINPENGDFDWIWEVPKTVKNSKGINVNTYSQIGSLALTNNGDLVLGTGASGVYSRCLFSVNKTGNTKWYNLGANGSGVVSGITIGKNGVLYYYSRLGELGLNLLAVNPESGGIIWKRKIESALSSSNNIVIDSDGNLICTFKDIGKTDFKLYRLNPTNGKILWTSTDNASSQNGTLLSKDGKIYQYFQWEHGLNSFDPQTGQKTNIEAPWPGAIDNQNRLVHNYINASLNQDLYVRQIDGTLNWSVTMYGLINDFLITDNKVIYGQIRPPYPAIHQHKICAIQGDETLASTGWPKLSHDNRNTNNWNKK